MDRHNDAVRKILYKVYLLGFDCSLVDSKCGLCELNQINRFRGLRGLRKTKCLIGDLTDGRHLL
jgi:hypothetical protein